jgi:ascorbate-specific PTS system EIIC-type component UlaA
MDEKKNSKSLITGMVVAIIGILVVAGGAYGAVKIFGNNEQELLTKTEKLLMNSC